MSNARDNRIFYKTETFHNRSVFKNRRTLRNLSMKSFNEGMLSITRVSDGEVVYAGTYTKLKELYPQLEV